MWNVCGGSPRCPGRLASRVQVQSSTPPCGGTVTLAWGSRLRGGPGAARSASLDSHLSNALLRWGIRLLIVPGTISGHDFRDFRRERVVTR